MKVDLSIIIVSFNTRQLTIETIESIEKNYPEEIASGVFEILVSDNHSNDDSVAALEEYKMHSKIKNFILFENKENFGFSKGNNIAILHAQGRYLLFLNSDTLVPEKTLTTMIDFMDTHKDAGASSCEVLLPHGVLDDASHRGFPTPWNSFCHFSGLEKLFPHARLFAGYTLGWEKFNTIHEVDAIAGAFMLVRAEAGKEIHWWDEDFFFYGEDLDFCYRLREKGWKVYFVPTVSILHYKGVSSGIKKHTQHLTTADIERKRKVHMHRFEAMKLFYQKHYIRKYPAIMTWIVYKGIDFLEKNAIAKIV